MDEQRTIQVKLFNLVWERYLQPAHAQGLAEEFKPTENLIDSVADSSLCGLAMLEL